MRRKSGNINMMMTEVTTILMEVNPKAETVIMRPKTKTFCERVHLFGYETNTSFFKYFLNFKITKN